MKQPIFQDSKGRDTLFAGKSLQKQTFLSLYISFYIFTKNTIIRHFINQKYSL